MPLITVQLFEGRTVEQKREYAKALTEASDDEKFFWPKQTTPQQAQFRVHFVAVFAFGIIGIVISR